MTERLLAGAREENDGYDIAVLTTNLGYEHLLAEQWQTAEDLFEQAIALFTECGAQRDVVNARANLLECPFARMPPDGWNSLLPMLADVNRALVASGDWRARFAEYRGRRFAARGWARRALAASAGIPTQLREWDRAYLQALEDNSSALERSPR